jgi:hypothetical protein
MEQNVVSNISMILGASLTLYVLATGVFLISQNRRPQATPGLDARLLLRTRHRRADRPLRPPDIVGADFATVTAQISP